MAQAKNSVAMEPLGFKKGLDRLLDEGIDEKVVTTDRHPSIRKIMRESYPDKKKHEFDPWHTSKGESNSKISYQGIEHNPWATVYTKSIVCLF